MLLELNGLSGDAVLKKYTWGLDLGGQTSPARQQGSIPQGAGGIGGLLATNVVSGAKDYLYYYDNLGNVGQMTDHSGTFVAKYEYNTYGGVQTKNGSYAGKNPFRFSTKYFDDETGLRYWVFRYYSPSLGRWLNRDPLEEYGGLELYAYAKNRPISAIDALGLLVQGDDEKEKQDAKKKPKCCQDECEFDRTEYKIKLAVSTLRPNASELMHNSIIMLEIADAVEALSHVAARLATAPGIWAKFGKAIPYGAEGYTGHSFLSAIGSATESLISNIEKRQIAMHIWYRVERRECTLKRCHRIQFYHSKEYYLAWTDWDLMEPQRLDGWQMAGLNGENVFHGRGPTDEQLANAAEEAADKYDCGSNVRVGSNR